MSDVNETRPMQQLSDDHPLMAAWEKYRATPEAANSDQWARTLDVSKPMQGQIIIGHPHLVGALWAAFSAGFAVDVRRGEETGWVIEREDSEPSRPMYWAGFQWEYDNLKAIRYARKEDAQKASKYMFPGEPHRIADHMWCP